jgi:hypothetical protein
VYSSLAHVLASVHIRTLIDLLNCGKDEWAEMKEEARSEDPPTVSAVRKLKATIQSLQALAEQSKLQGDLAVIGTADRVHVHPAQQSVIVSQCVCLLLGKRVTIVTGRKPRVSEQVTLTSQLAVEARLARYGVGSLQLVDQVAGPAHYPSKYSEFVAGCTYSLSSLLDTLDARTTHHGRFISVREGGVNGGVVSCGVRMCTWI